MAWHPEILTPRQRRVLALIGRPLGERGFFLAGGTAVALHLGHRRSADFDWFAPEFDDPARVADDLRGHGIDLRADQIAPGTLHGAVGGVRITLLRHRYPMLAKLRPWPGGVRIAGRADLAAMKLLAVAQRGAKKDFVDIYAVAQQKKSLQQMVQSYRQKYQTGDIAHLLCSLAYFDDAERERMPRMLWDVRWRDVKKTIRQWVERIPR